MFQKSLTGVFSLVMRTLAYKLSSASIIVPCFLEDFFPLLR